MQWEFLDDLGDEIESYEGSIRKAIFRSLQRMIQVRKSLPALAGQAMDLVSSNNPHVLCFLRQNDGHRLIVAANFSEVPQAISGNTLRTAGLGRFFQDAITAETYPTSEDLLLEPYQYLWLARV